MMRFFLSILLVFIVSSKVRAQQKPLPSVEVISIGEKVILNWKNYYIKPIVALNIQRSFDSLKNFKTIGSVLSPNSKENGYADNNAPYNKMYYRVFVAFEGGTYAYSKTMRPIKDTSARLEKPETAFPWLQVKDNDSSLILPGGKPKITYPSQNVYTLKDNNVIIHLQNTEIKKYSIKFYNDVNTFLFEIRRVKEDNLIIEKVNFGKTGTYFFELFLDGELIERNEFRILKPVKGI
jgi:hypothetical protein